VNFIKKEDGKLEQILTNEHQELINKKIKKAINEIDYTEIVTAYIEKEFDTLWEDCGVRHDLQGIVTEVIKQHLVKSGLLKYRDDITTL
jgi:hypothetical protein